MQVRRTLKACLWTVLIGWSLNSSVGQAEQYPNRPVEIVVPYAAGGGVGNFFSSLREALAKRLGVEVGLVYRPGGGGVVGASFVGNSKPDGYTLLGHEIGTFLCSQAVTPKIAYRVLEDFEPIVQCGTVPFVLAVRSESEFKTIEDLIAFARKNPDKLIAGTSGVGTTTHLELELLNNAAGTRITHLPLSGGAEVVANLLGGHIDLTIANLGVLKPHFRAGKMRALLTATPNRIPGLPEVPTSLEKGMPDVNINMSLGLWAPKAIPEKALERISTEMSEVLKMPNVLANLERFEYTADYLAPGPFKNKLKKDYDTYVVVYKKAGLLEK